jgi:hypothetical protein
MKIELIPGTWEYWWAMSMLAFHTPRLIASSIPRR